MERAGVSAVRSGNRTPAVLRYVHGGEGASPLLSGKEGRRGGRIYDICPVWYQGRFERLHHNEPGGRGDSPCQRKED